MYSGKCRLEGESHFVQQDRYFQDLSNPVLYRSRLVKVRSEVCLHRFHSLQYLSCFDHGTVLANRSIGGIHIKQASGFGYLDPYLCSSTYGGSNSQSNSVNLSRRKGIFWKLCKFDRCICLCLSNHMLVLLLENRRQSTWLLYPRPRFLLRGIPFANDTDATLDTNLPVLDCLAKFQILHHNGCWNHD